MQYEVSPPSLKFRRSKGTRRAASWKPVPTRYEVHRFFARSNYGALPQAPVTFFISIDFLVHFLLAQKMNQKRAPEMPTSAFLGARYTKPYWRYQKDCSSLHFRVFRRAVSMILCLRLIISGINKDLVALLAWRRFGFNLFSKIDLVAPNQIPSLEGAGVG